MIQTNPTLGAPGFRDSRHGACLGWAAICVVLALFWQFLTVRYNYERNWSGLFYTGGHWVAPPALASENVQTFPDTFGYDGQFYH